MKVDIKKVKDAIRDSGLQKQFIAKKLGTTPDQVSHILGGRREFTEKQYEAFCELVDIDRNELVTREVA